MCLWWWKYEAKQMTGGKSVHLYLHSRDLASLFHSQVPPFNGFHISSDSNPWLQHAGNCMIF
jgi:hypothetical protein